MLISLIHCELNLISNKKENTKDENDHESPLILASLSEAQVFPDVLGGLTRSDKIELFLLLTNFNSLLEMFLGLERDKSTADAGVILGSFQLVDFMFNLSESFFVFELDKLTSLLELEDHLAVVENWINP